MMHKIIVVVENLPETPLWGSQNGVIYIYIYISAI